MAQVVTNVPGNFGTNPSGVGAVIFGEDVSPLQIHLQNLKQFDEGQQRRQVERQQKLRLGMDMLSDLNPEVKGIMDSDQPYFQERAKGIQDYYRQMYQAGVNPDSPQFLEAYTQGQNLKKSIELDAQQSATQKEMLFKYLQEAASHPDKYDLDKTNENIAKFRMSPFDVRRNFDIGKILVPRKSDLLELTKGKVLKDVPLDAASVTIKDPTTGGYITETVKTYTPEHVRGLAQAGYLGDPDITEAVDLMYDQKLDDNKRISYEQQAQAETSATGRTVSPKEIFYREYIKGISPLQKTKGGLTFTPWQREAAKQAGEEKNDAEYVKYVAEALKNAQGDSPDFWEIEDVQNVPAGEKVSGSMQSAFGVGFNVPRIMYSQALNNLPLGSVPIPIYKTDPSTGEPVIVNGRKVISGYDNIPNRVLNMKKTDGKVYIQTDETLIKQMNGEQGATGWEEVTDRTIDKLVLGSKNPVKAAAQLRQTLLGMNAYPGTNVKLGGGAAAKKATNQDQAALQWLEANPNAPQAAAIRKKLQEKGLIK